MGCINSTKLKSQLRWIFTLSILLLFAIIVSYKNVAYLIPSYSFRGNLKVTVHKCEETI